MKINMFLRVCRFPDDWIVECLCLLTHEQVNFVYIISRYSNEGSAVEKSLFFYRWMFTLLAASMCKWMLGNDGNVLIQKLIQIARHSHRIQIDSIPTLTLLPSRSGSFVSRCVHHFKIAISTDVDIIKLAIGIKCTVTVVMRGCHKFQFNPLPFCQHLKTNIQILIGPLNRAPVAMGECVGVFLGAATRRGLEMQMIDQTRLPDNATKK